MDAIKPGLTGEHQTKVTREMTARALGSGNVDVYATPSMIALMETAAVAAIDPLLPAGKVSVGVMVEVQHIAATGVGHDVRAQAEVTEVQGRQVTFRVQAWEDNVLIGQGTHSRFVVDTASFMQGIQEIED